MRKEQVVLKDVSKATALRRNIDASIAVEQRLSVDDDPSAARTQDARDGIDDRRLSGSRSTEQPDDRRLGPERHLELEITYAAFDVDVDHERW